jgi:hypothetical protein
MYAGRNAIVIRFGGMSPFTPGGHGHGVPERPAVFGWNTPRRV